MIIYCRSKYKPKKKRKPKVELATKFTPQLSKSFCSEVKMSKVPQYRAPDHSHIPSLETNTPFTGARNSVMEPSVLAKESAEVREEIIAKSKRISIPFNKGAYQYIDTPDQAINIGRK
jgi:hypothetical protein